MTLLEVVIAMGVSLAMLAAGTMLYVNGIKQAVANQANAMGNTQAQKLTATIENEIQQAIMVPTGGAEIDGNHYDPSATQLVLQLPSWTTDGDTVKTIPDHYDNIVYKFVQYETVGGAQHKTYNLWKIVSPDELSSRTAFSGWVFPYSESLDASDSTKFRSDPYVQYWEDDGTPTIFKYYVQDPATLGAVKAKDAGDAWAEVVMVETRMTIKKKYDKTTLDSSIATRTRLRNWEP
jgi:hypothetical protein